MEGNGNDGRPPDFFKGTENLTEEEKRLVVGQRRRQYTLNYPLNPSAEPFVSSENLGPQQGESTTNVGTPITDTQVIYVQQPAVPMGQAGFNFGGPAPHAGQGPPGTMVPGQNYGFGAVAPPPYTPPLAYSQPMATPQQPMPSMAPLTNQERQNWGMPSHQREPANLAGLFRPSTPPPPQRHPDPETVSLFREVLTIIKDVDAKHKGIEAKVSEFAASQAALLKEMADMKSAAEARASSSATATTSSASGRGVSPRRGASTRLLKSQSINRPITADDITPGMQDISITPAANAPAVAQPTAAAHAAAAPAAPAAPTVPAPAVAAPAQEADDRDRLLKQQLETVGDDDRRILLADPTTLNKSDQRRRKELYNLRNRSCMNCRGKGHDIHECINPCGICDQPDHKRPNCPQKTCVNCGQLGHELKNCPNPCGSCGSTEHKKPDCKPKKQPPPKKDDGSGPSGGGGGDGTDKGAGPKKPPPKPPTGRKDSSSKGSSKRSSSRRQDNSKLAQSSAAALSQQHSSRKDSASSKGWVRASSTVAAKRSRTNEAGVRRAEPYGYRYRPLKAERRVHCIYGGLPYFIGWSCPKMALGILIERKTDYGLDKNGRELLHPTVVQFGFESFSSIMNTGNPAFDIGDVVTLKSYVPIQTRSNPNVAYNFRNPKNDLNALLNTRGKVDPDALALDFELRERSYIARKNQILANVKSDIHVEDENYAQLTMTLVGNDFIRGHEVANANISEEFDLTSSYNWKYVLADYCVAPAIAFCRLGQMVVPAQVAEEVTPLVEPFRMVYHVKSVPRDLKTDILQHGNFTGFGTDVQRRTNVFYEVTKPANLAACCAERWDHISSKRLARTRVDITEFRQGHVMVLKVTPLGTGPDYIQAILREYKPVSDLILYQMVKDESNKDTLKTICRLRSIEATTGEDDMITQMHCRRVIELDRECAISKERLDYHYQFDGNHVSDQLWWDNNNLPTVNLIVLPRLSDISIDQRVELLNLLDVDTTSRPSANLKHILNFMSGVHRPRVAKYEKYMDPDLNFPNDFLDLSVYVSSQAAAKTRAEAVAAAEDRPEGPRSPPPGSTASTDGSDPANSVDDEDEDEEEPTEPNADDSDGNISIDEEEETEDIQALGDSIENIEVDSDEEEPEQPRAGSNSGDNTGEVREEQMLVDDEVPDRDEYFKKAWGELIPGGPKSVDQSMRFACLHLIESLRTDASLNQGQKEALCELLVEEAPQVVIQAPFGTGKTLAITKYDEYLTHEDNRQPIFKDTHLLIVAEVNGAVDKIAEEVLEHRRVTANIRRDNYDPATVLVYKSESSLAQDDLTVIVEKSNELRQRSSLTEHAHILLRNFNNSLDQETKEFLEQYCEIRRNFNDVITNDGKVLNLVLMYNTSLEVVICTRALACASDDILQWTNRVAFDEASQIRHIDALLLVANMPNLVQTLIVGDSAQLGPYIRHNFFGRFTGISQQSVLSFLAKHQPKVFRFSVTHRCGREMAKLVARTIYWEGLESARWDTPMFQSSFFPVAREKFPVVLIHTTGRATQLTSKTWRNRTQCNIAHDLVSMIKRHMQGKRPKVAVLCAYKGDATALREMLAHYSRTIPHDKFFESLTVESIRSYMGNENDITILVTGRESGVQTNRRLDTPFPLLPEPFVVAVTRARELTFIIGNMDFLVSQQGSIIEKFIMETAKDAPPVLDEWYLPYLQGKQPGTPPIYHPQSGLLVAQRDGQYVNSFVATCIPSTINGFSAKALMKTGALRQDFGDLASRLAQARL